MFAKKLKISSNVISHPCARATFLRALFKNNIWKYFILIAGAAFVSLLTRSFVCGKKVLRLHTHTLLHA
jgi:hypothetical protein